jgi:carbonic anhydrase/acetyltransferase-like protein (isoleucine patch superfamily)
MKEAFMIHKIGSRIPDTKDAAFIAWNAEVAGDAALGRDASVWFGAVLRADLQPITIGEESNVQDNATLHVTSSDPCVIGKRVSVGHGAVVHAAVVGDECLIGIGAIILSGAVIGGQSIVGAGALVTENKVFPPRSLIYGSPARLVRGLTDEEVRGLRATAERYVKKAKEAAVLYGE